MRSAFFRYKKITRFCLFPTRKGRVFCVVPGSISPSSTNAFIRLRGEQEKFSPCVRFSRGGWDTYPTPEKKAAHRGDSGVCWLYTVWVVWVLQVCFQLQKQILQVPQRFFAFSIRCVPATQQRQKNIFQMQAAAVPHFCHGKRNADSTAGATTFSLLPHLPHIIFTRLPLL